MVEILILSIVHFKTVSIQKSVQDNINGKNGMMFFQRLGEVISWLTTTWINLILFKDCSVIVILLHPQLHMQCIQMQRHLFWHNITIKLEFMLSLFILEVYHGLSQLMATYLTILMVLISFMQREILQQRQFGLLWQKKH